MISPNSTLRATAPWQKQLANAVTQVDELLQLLGLSPEDLPLANLAAFPLRVPHAFIARMQPGNPRDPLLLQVLPLAQELAPLPGYTADPLHEAAASPVPGLLHKYHGRVLLLVSGACGIHCRYCFRRHFPYAEHALGKEAWTAALDYIRRTPSLAEVIFSGGDPLAASDARLRRLVTALAEVEHLARLRIHTRMPIVLPARVNDDLLGWLTATRLQPIVVVHANHPQELDSAVIGALSRLRTAGVTLLNQAVLMRGINDDAVVLSELSHRLFAAGVLPYYLHLLDPVAGAAHFSVSVAVARELVQQLLQKLPGYLVPRLVREAPGALAKLPVDLELSTGEPLQKVTAEMFAKY